jgi:hypothetical protein
LDKPKVDLVRRQILLQRLYRRVVASGLEVHRNRNSRKLFR